MEIRENVVKRHGQTLVLGKIGFSVSNTYVGT